MPEQLWERVNGIIAEQRNKRTRPGRRPVRLFGGLTRCRCGKAMYVPSNTPKYVCQSCRNKIPVEDLEAVFHEQLQGFVLSPEEVAAQLAASDRRIREKEELLAALEAEQRDARREMDKVYRAYVEEAIPMEAFGRNYRPLEERFAQLEEEIPRLQGELDFLKIQHLSSDEVVSEARDLYARWPKLTGKEKRRVVEEIVDEIEIGEDELQIQLRYLLPNSFPMVAKGHRMSKDSERSAPGGQP